MRLGDQRGEGGDHGEGTSSAQIAFLLIILPNTGYKGTHRKNLGNITLGKGK